MDVAPPCNYTSPRGNCNYSNQCRCNIPANDSCNNKEDSSDCNLEEAIIYDFAGVVTYDNGYSHDYYKKRDDSLNQEKKDDSTKAANIDDKKDVQYVHTGVYTNICGEVYDCFKEIQKSEKDDKAVNKEGKGEDKPKSVDPKKNGEDTTKKNP